MAPVLIMELHSAIAVMVGRAKRAEDAALRRATAQPFELGAVRLHGEIQQLREVAQEVASEVARLTAEVETRTLATRPRI